MAKTLKVRLRSEALKHLSAKDAKYGFGRLIDLARLEPVIIEKHGRPVVAVLAIEEFERLRGQSSLAQEDVTRDSLKADLTRSGLDEA